MNKKIQILKNGNSVDKKSSNWKMKSVLDHTCELAEERISEHKDKDRDFPVWRTEWTKHEEENEQIQRELWDTITMPIYT